MAEIKELYYKQEGRCDAGCRGISEAVRRIYRKRLSRRQDEFQLYGRAYVKHVVGGEIAAVQAYGGQEGMSGLFAWWEE